MWVGMFVADDKINDVIKNNHIINNKINFPYVSETKAGAIAGTTFTNNRCIINNDYKKQHYKWE